MTNTIMVHLIKPQKQPQISDKNVAFLTAENIMSKSRGKHEQKGGMAAKARFANKLQGLLKLFAKILRLKNYCAGVSWPQKLGFKRFPFLNYDGKKRLSSLANPNPMVCVRIHKTTYELLKNVRS
jgi:hypothetical protein